MDAKLSKACFGTWTLTVAVACCAMTLSRAAADALAPAGHTTIGIPSPQGQIGDGANAADVGEPVRQSLAKSLSTPSVSVVALQSKASDQIDSEAKALHCDYVLYAHVEQKHGGGVGGFLHKLAPFASALPMLGGLGHAGGGGVGSALSGLSQTAASASAGANQQELMQQMAGAQRSGVKAGDTVTLEYRLVATGSTDVVKGDKLVLKAKADGEDVISPAVEQAASAVAAATGHSGTGTAPATTANLASGSGAGRSPTTKGLDCDHLPAGMSATISPEACRKMRSSQLAYGQAASDPSAARPGDEQMSCEQIAQELQAQSFRAPDKATAAEQKGAGQQEQALLARQQAELAQTAAVQQVAINAANASDRAAELASGGLAHPGQASALEQTFIKQNWTTSQKMAEERKPTEQRLTSSTADLGAAMSQQLTENPRLARLIQLSSAKRCKRT